jgi:hypothetical protein
MEHAVTHASLLRTVTSITVQQQFRRIARGGARLGRGYDYQYFGPRSEGGHSRTALDFVVDPLSIPPSNIHVLTGRNRVGKTTLLREIARAAVRVDQADDGSGFWPTDAVPSAVPMLANVVSISFSAFDPFADFEDQRPDGPVSFEYVGLRIRAGAHDERESHTDLAAEFSGSLSAIHSSGRTQRWARAVSGLMTDPAFAASSVPGLVDDMAGTGPDTFTHEGPQRLFAELSSGHASVLLILTRLVELVAAPAGRRRPSPRMPGPNRVSGDRQQAITQAAMCIPQREGCGFPAPPVARLPTFSKCELNILAWEDS